MAKEMKRGVERQGKEAGTVSAETREHFHCTAIFYVAIPPSPPFSPHRWKTPPLPRVRLAICIHALLRHVQPLRRCSTVLY